jgi:hypothetical protein
MQRAIPWYYQEKHRKEAALAKTNYKYEKRQKQIDKKKKQDEKLRRKQEKKKGPPEAGTEAATETATVQPAEK